MPFYSSGLVDVHSTTSYPSTPQVDLSKPVLDTSGNEKQAAFRPKHWIVTSEGAATDQVAFSFDGAHDHGILTAGANYTTRDMNVVNKQQMWLRGITTTSTTKIQVMAWD
jgi:hypothetical protein